MPPSWAQPRALSKLLNLGMPLEQVIAAGSTRPSSFLDPTEDKDWLQVGQKADLTVFRVDQANISVEDSLGDHLTLTQLIHPLLAVQGTNHAECSLRFQ